MTAAEMFTLIATLLTIIGSIFGLGIMIYRSNQVLYTDMQFEFKAVREDMQFDFKVVREDMQSEFKTVREDISMINQRLSHTDGLLEGLRDAITGRTAA